MSDEDRRNLFTVLDVSNQGKNTYTKLTGLKLEQGETYYVWVVGKEALILINWILKCEQHLKFIKKKLIILCFILNSGTDKSGECAMTHTEFLVDVTDPKQGQIKTGPWYSMVGLNNLLECFRWRIHLRSNLLSTVLQANIHVLLIFLQPVSYSTDNSSVNVSWEGFTDPESGVSSYEISLWKNESCLEGSETTLVNDWIKLSSNYSFYQFVDQILEV